MLGASTTPIREPGGADHHRDAALAAGSQMGQRAFGAGEVDQHLCVGQADREVVRHLHTAGMAQPSGGVLADARVAGMGQCAGQRAVVGLVNRLDQHAAHAAAGAGDRDPNHQFSSGG
jgi:hypothetical protein